MLIEPRTARLWTPERVPLTLPLAGLGERAIAYLIDLAVLLVAGVGGLFIYNIWGDLQQDVGALSALGTVVLGLALFGAAVLYDVLFEVLGAGRTPGKRAMALRVLHAGGRPPDVFTALLRNVVRLVDILPFGYVAGTVTLFFTGTRRIGDLVADTFVVTERARHRDPLEACRRAAGGPQRGSGSSGSSGSSGRSGDGEVLDRGIEGGLRRATRRPWSSAAQRRALEMVERTDRMHAAQAEVLCFRALRALDAELATTEAGQARAALARQCLAHAGSSEGPLAALARVLDAERALAGALARLTDAATMAEVEHVDLAIRRAASELMRAGRRGVPAHHLETLSLTLLDAERRRAPRVVLGVAVRRFFLEEVPAAVWGERQLVARAGAVLALGLFVGGGVAYADGALARALVGDNVARLVEKGATWTNQIEQAGSFAEASLQIIINNIGVGARVFALGLLGGVATVLGLLSNGVQIGATFGYALRLGTADTLLRFILAHGPVELTMIAVAGAGGMCLGRALLSPGARTRLRALREEGARGVRLVTAASLGFLCIGTVEGFVSPGALFPWGVNAALGLALLGLFWAWVVAWGRKGQPTSS